MAEPVRVAHDQGFPPFAEIKDGKSEGLAVDIFRAAATRAGIEVKFVPVPFEQKQLTLEGGRADAYFPLSITPERLQLFDFTDELVVTGGSIFVRAPNAPPNNLTALAGIILVTPRTGPIAPFIQRAAVVKLVVTTDYEDSLNRLIRGEADAAALGFHVGLHISEPNNRIPSHVHETAARSSGAKRKASRPSRAIERWNCRDTCRWYVATDQRALTGGRPDRICHHQGEQRDGGAGIVQLNQFQHVIAGHVIQP